MSDARPNRRLVLAATIGLAAGVLSGLFGIGGGVILVPALVLFFALPQLEASAISLAAIVMGATAGLIPFALDREVDWMAGLVLTAGAVIGSFLASRYVARIPERVLAWTFVVVVLAAAVRMLVPSAEASPTDVDLAAWTIALLGATGLFAGFTAVTLGLGGGRNYFFALC